MTRRGTWLRYALLSALLIGIHLVIAWYFSEGVYQGGANVPLLRFPEEVDVIFVLTFTPTFIGLKFLAYDSAVYVPLTSPPTRRTHCATCPP